MHISYQRWLAVFEFPFVIHKNDTNDILLTRHLLWFPAFPWYGLFYPIRLKIIVCFESCPCSIEFFQVSHMGLIFFSFCCGWRITIFIPSTCRQHVGYRACLIFPIALLLIDFHRFCFLINYNDVCNMKRYFSFIVSCNFLIYHFPLIVPIVNCYTVLSWSKE